MKIVLIDNYDSFTYNVVQRLGEIDGSLDIEVVRNNEIDVDGVRARKPDKIVISPGPGDPTDAGISNKVIAELHTEIPILGICLGCQCIGHVFGGVIVRAQKIMHGKTSEMQHDGKGVFKELPQPFVATRYHSLVIEEASLPAELEITCRALDGLGEIMGVRHKTAPLHGVQFHPESFLSHDGFGLLDNFLKL